MHPTHSPPPRSRRKLFIGLLVVGMLLTFRFTRDQPVTHPSAEEQFKYGSLGNEHAAGLPVALWSVLPELFAKYLPGPGYASLGFIYETNHPFPIGLSQRNVAGVNQVALNCAACHTGTVRDTPQSPRRIILGMPANGFNFPAFTHFLAACARDEQFNSTRLVDEIARHQDENALNQLTFRYATVNQTRQQFLTLGQRLDFVEHEPEAGPGRMDPFNSLKARLNFPLEKLSPEEWVGNCDLPALWNQSKRTNFLLHWDGSSHSLTECQRIAAFASGATPTTLDRTSLQRITDFLATNQPPRWPHDLDLAKSGAGEKIYLAYCARCHGRNGRDFTGELVGQITPIEKIKTDRHRLDANTEELSANLGSLFAAYPEERFSHFRKTHGYANSPLDGLWLRGPYLHNGSVPTLRELLEPAAHRPTVFYRGYDVIDHERVGFVADVAEENGRKYFKFDTRLPGNGNTGHEGREFGTELSAADKDALVEYLKTF